MPESVVDKQDELLKKIRQRFRYGMDRWSRIREEGQINMRYVSGDPWTDAEKQARAGRPTVCADELNQYVNQVVNTARQNPRGIKVDPAGDGATEELAEYRENRIRAIEYACNASRVYINGLQAAVERNIGFWKVTRAYVADDSEEQEIIIVPVMNPDSIVFDPDYKTVDGSDARWCFELDRLTLDEFEREYPDAEKVSFNAEDFGGAENSSYWFDGKSIVLASYYEVQTEEKRIGKRTVMARTGIKQYITNGAEILKEGPLQPGPYLSIVPVFGKELWVDYGSGSERLLLSLVSLARDPQKALAYVMSSMLENVGQLPKTTFIGAVGQFETDKETWDTINTVFHPYAQYDKVTDEATGALLPAPERSQKAPDFGAYATGVDICHRAVMSAMGLQTLPTAAARSNQKSGVAIEKIQSQQAVGSYHLVDSYDQAIKLTGRIINNWLAETDLGDTLRPVRYADGKHKLVQINTDQPVKTESGKKYNIPIADDAGRYQVTISSGPSHESQREEASEFVDTIVANLKNLPIPPQQQAQILGVAIRMKQLGPLGDQMADIIAPQNNEGQQMAAMQAQMGQLQQVMQAMGEKMQQLMLEKQGKIIEMQAKQQLQAEQNAFDMAEGDKDREVKLAVAEIGTKQQVESERIESYNEAQSQLHAQAHEAGLQAADHAHEREMHDRQAQATAAQSAQDAAMQQAQSANSSSNQQ